MLKKFNGIPTNAEDDASKLATTAATVASTTNGTGDSITVAAGPVVVVAPPPPPPAQYNISMWYEESDFQYLSIEKVKDGGGTTATAAETTSTSVADNSSTNADVSAEKTGTSNGSVTSVGPFSLPNAVVVGTTTSSSSSSTITTLPSDSSTSSTSLTTQPAISAATGTNTKQTVTGVVALCNFMIDHFSQLKRTHAPADEYGRTPGTPVTGRKGALKSQKGNAAASSPDLLSGGGKKRGATKRSYEEDDSEPIKSAKQAKTVSQPAATEELRCDAVLARWVDKLYYAGRVTQAKAGNKYVVRFEDGASKTLPKEHIVFGEEDVLPLLDQSVHALIAKDTYEPGLVTLVNKSDDGESVLYTVTTESKTVTVTSSDIYLEEDQAKMIQKSIQDIEGGGGGGDSTELLSTPSAKRAGRPSMKMEESQTGSGGRGGRVGSAKKSGQPAASTTPEPGFSGNVAGGGGGTNSGGGGGGRSGRRTKRYS